ncbi:MAG: type II toxin-antitoxin system prevent-host-death family antitoxin [Steroidobacteraceae bacterium]
MKDVKVTELRARLPAYLERVRRGEHLKVTSRGLGFRRELRR